MEKRRGMEMRQCTDSPLIKRRIFSAINLFKMKNERREKIETMLDDMQGMTTEWWIKNQENAEEKQDPPRDWMKKHPFRNAQASIRGLCGLDPEWTPPQESDPQGWLNDEVCFFFFI